MSRISSLLGSAVLVLGCAFASAQSTEVASNKVVDAVVTPAAATTYTFTEVNFAGDTFTQLLGINKNGVIAGYHGSGADAQHPNKGFTMTLPNHFTAQNFPSSAQTQVIGINNSNSTSGFYVDAAGNTHGFYQIGGVFKTLDFFGTTFNQVLGWNNLNQGAGYWQDAAGVFHPYVADTTQLFTSFLGPGKFNSQATGANDIGTVVGFIIDGNQVNHRFHSDVREHQGDHLSRCHVYAVPGRQQLQRSGRHLHRCKRESAWIYVEGGRIPVDRRSQRDWFDGGEWY